MMTNIRNNFGIPQRTILFPALLLIYINYLVKLSIPNCNIISFAGDITLTFIDTWDTIYKHAASILCTAMA